MPCRCGPSFEVYVVSQQFEGKRLLERHKLINAAVAEFMPEIHVSYAGLQGFKLQV